MRRYTEAVQDDLRKTDEPAPKAIVDKISQDR